MLRRQSRRYFKLWRRFKWRRGKLHPSQSGIYWVCPLRVLNMPPWCENVSIDCHLCLKVLTLSRRSLGYLKLCRQFWKCWGKLHPSQSDGFDWVCPLHTQHDILMRKRVRWLPNMSHRLPIVKAIMWVLQTLEWGQMAPRTGVKATAGCLSSIPHYRFGSGRPNS